MRSTTSSRTVLAVSMVALGGLFLAGCCSLEELNSELRQGDAAIFILSTPPQFSFPKNLNQIRESYHFIAYGDFHVTWDHQDYRQTIPGKTK